MSEIIEHEIPTENFTLARQYRKQAVQDAVAEFIELHRHEIHELSIQIFKSKYVPMLETKSSEAPSESLT